MVDRPPSPAVPREAELIALTIVPHVIAEAATPVIDPEAPVVAAARLLADAAAEAVAVVDSTGGYLGLVGLRDVARAAAMDRLQAPVSEAMQPRHDWLVPDDAPLDALELLRTRGVEHLPVLAPAGNDAASQPGERFVGIVSRSHLVNLLHRQFERQAMQRQRQIFGIAEEP